MRGLIRVKSWRCLCMFPGLLFTSFFFNLFISIFKSFNFDNRIEITFLFLIFFSFNFFKYLKFFLKIFITSLKTLFFFLISKKEKINLSGPTMRVAYLFAKPMVDDMFVSWTGQGSKRILFLSGQNMVTSLVRDASFALLVGPL